MTRIARSPAIDPLLLAQSAEQASFLGVNPNAYRYFHLQRSAEFAGAVALAAEAAPAVAQVVDLGMMATENERWPGSVSASKLLETGRLSEDTINGAILRLNEFYVSVHRGAKTRCIDGRTDPKLDEKHLGPQVPGGAAGAALAYRIGIDKDDLTRGTFLVDAKAMIDWFVRLNFAPGGHRDSLSNGTSKKAGCGFVDGMDIILGTMVDTRWVDDHKRVTRGILNDGFDRDTYLRNVGAAVMLNGHSEEYFSGREQVLDVLEERSKESVSVLEGEHEEAIMVVNFVPGETLSSNRFSNEFGFQAFGYDIWRSVQMASKLLPRPEQAEERQRFVMARVMTTIATMMALTDGSLRLVLRVPTLNPNAPMQELIVPATRRSQRSQRPR